jgi:hypothetical protein
MPPRPTTACLASISTQFRAESRLPADRLADAQILDDLALAALCICTERRGQASPVDVACLIRCRDALNGRRDAALIGLPFQLAMSLFPGAATMSAEQLLFPYANHHSSSVRYYAFELAWLIRKHLDCNAMTRPLLQNVENTLGYWVESMALCKSLYAAEDEFWAAVDRYRPVEFQEQFEARVAHVRAHPDLLLTPPGFARTEARILRLVLQHALAAAGERGSIIELRFDEVLPARDVLLAPDFMTPGGNWPGSPGICLKCQRQLDGTWSLWAEGVAAPAVEGAGERLDGADGITTAVQFCEAYGRCGVGMGSNPDLDDLLAHLSDFEQEDPSFARSLRERLNPR